MARWYPSSSASLGLDLYMDVIKHAVDGLGTNRLRIGGATIHSDHGFHYTLPLYIKYLVDRGIAQSRSRKGNCLANAPVEFFFGHLNDEIDLTSCLSLDKVNAVVGAYIHDHNHHPYQMDKERKEVVPVEYMDHLVAG